MLEAYNQRAPLFDPEKSSTYKNVSCSSSLCLQGSPCSGSNNSIYQYSMKYGDSSFSNGDLARTVEHIYYVGHYS